MNTKRAFTVINITMVGALVVLMVLAELVQTVESNRSAAATSAAATTPLISFGGSGVLSYMPDTLTAHVGEAVEWRGSLAEHPLISVEALWPRQASGGSFSYTFAKPGTYHYYCQFHGGPTGGMAGTVVVQ